MDLFEHTTLATPELYDPAIDQLLAPFSEKVTYPAKQTFCMPGKKLDFIYFIKSGRTKHYMVNADGSTKLIYTLTAGWFFGETAFFLKTPTSLHSQTETATVMYKVPYSICDNLMATSPAFRESIIKCYSLKVLMLRYEIENLTFNSAKGRLKKLFCSAVDLERISTDGQWYDLKIKYNHSELGEIIGGTRVTICRQVNELCNEGFVRSLNHRIQLNAKKYDQYVEEQLSVSD